MRLDRYLAVVLKKLIALNISPEEFNSKNVLRDMNEDSLLGPSFINTIFKRYRDHVFLANLRRAKNVCYNSFYAYLKTSCSAEPYHHLWEDVSQARLICRIRTANQNRFILTNLSRKANLAQPTLNDSKSDWTSRAHGLCFLMAIFVKTFRYASKTQL